MYSYVDFLCVSAVSLFVMHATIQVIIGIMPSIMLRGTKEVAMAMAKKKVYV